jgi:hypothetical protein
MKELDISELKARKLVKRMCEDFYVPPCSIYYIDLTFLGSCLGLYEKASLDLTAYMLIERRWSRRLVLVLHEFSHHLQAELYTREEESHHGYGFQLAKGRVTTWAAKNISNNFDWFALLTANQMTGRYGKKR